MGYFSPAKRAISCFPLRKLYLNTEEVSGAGVPCAGLYYYNHCAAFQWLVSCFLCFGSFLKAGTVVLISRLSLFSLLLGR